MSDLQYRQLGQSGLRVSLVGLGTNNFGGRIDRDASRPVIHKALDLGINFFDTADVYGNKGGSESILGEVLGSRRKDVILATKFGSPFDEAAGLKGASRRYVFDAVDASLQRLRTDWIDLYQVHRPDPLTPIEETVRALQDLVRSGKVRYVGLSNFAPWQLVEAQWVARELGASAFISSQDEYSLLNRQAETERIPVLQQYGLGLLPFFPLAGGFLSGKYRPGEALPQGARLTAASPLAERTLTERNYRVAGELADFAATRGHTLLELAFSWLAAQPVVSSVIAGATRPEQLEQNARAVAWQLDNEALAQIDRITRQQ
ncbi:Predicted oxidoreductase [Andreprevotia lacus DSM 23236]|jgi:aryl-alcohol dehydrogenase-like predicted oxidoreductase|uniref:Predicted oxidoreductase n=1 Tax=Andreprevotia lacus DSM 23236 TaxID=1121001 RepID=A0A1W1XFR3_9NEIS|nr:aldo/keto reductase [Andreprevotia lacus]SMC22604.1 Predicted oxidoreductase [Andreprevotia lacus DSM 23236]